MSGSPNAPIGAGAHDSALAELIANEKARLQGGQLPEWGAPTEAEQAALRRLTN